jgi:hypothetical protein
MKFQERGFTESNHTNLPIKKFQGKRQKLNNPIKLQKPKFQNPQTEYIYIYMKKNNQQQFGYHPKQTSS